MPSNTPETQAFLPVTVAVDNTTADLLSEALDLCARARRLDEIDAACMEARMGGTRCITPAVWVAHAYERDLADWEARARAHLEKSVRYAGGKP